MKTIVLVVIAACFGIHSEGLLATGSPRADNDAKVTGARSDRTDNPREIALRDRLTVTVDYLKGLHDDALAKKKNIIIFLNGVGIPGSPPEAINLETKEIRFRLERTPDSKKAWTSLMGGALFTRTRTVSVSVGLEGDLPVPSNVEGTNGMTLIVIHGWAFVLWVIVSPLVLILVICLGRRTYMLRDAGKTDSGSPSYSLARTQMAFWFVLVVMAFTYVWLVTGALDTITESTLALMGIAAGTAVGAVIIDSGKKDSATVEKARLEAEKVTLIARQNAKLTEIKATVYAAQKLVLEEEEKQISTRLQEITQRVADLKPETLAPSTSHFFTDILTDANGVSFHRFQMMIWTLILGFIFIRSALLELAMPEFSATLLGLMGISSGTYLGFKFPEKQS